MENRSMDLRVRRTRQMLLSTFALMLNKQNFGKIAISDLCKKAVMGRACFYLHFHDKYDLLKTLLREIRESVVDAVSSYSVNSLIEANRNRIENLLQNADSETYSILQEFIGEVIEACVERNAINMPKASSVILSNFITGGIIQLLLWQIENDFPTETSTFNDYIYKLIESVAVNNTAIAEAPKRPLSELLEELASYPDFAEILAKMSQRQSV